MRHTLTFRGEDHAIPASFGLCTACGALMQIEAWMAEECSGRPAEKEETHEAR